MPASRPDPTPERARERAPEHDRTGHAERVLLIVDMMNALDFDGAQALAHPAARAAVAIAALKHRLAGQGVPAVYVNDHAGVWQADFGAVVERVRRRGGTPAALVRRLAPEPGDLTLLKPRHSAFYGTSLHLLLAQMGTREIVLTGVATDLCVQFTAMDAFERGFRLWVPGDCTGAQTTVRKRAALGWMARALKARIEASRSDAGQGTPFAEPAASSTASNTTA